MYGPSLVFYGLYLWKNAYLQRHPLPNFCQEAQKNKCRKRNKYCSFFCIKRDIRYLRLFLFALAACFTLTVKLGVAEIKRNVDGDKNKVEYVEEKREIEKETACIHSCKLDYLANDTASVTEEKEYLKEKALSLCGAGDEGLADRYRPGKTETKYG